MDTPGVADVLGVGGMNVTLYSAGTHDQASAMLGKSSPGIGTILQSTNDANAL